MNIKLILALTTLRMLAIMQAVSYPAEPSRLPQCTLCALPQTTIKSNAVYCECPETGVCGCEADSCRCVGCPVHTAKTRWTYDAETNAYWTPLGNNYWQKYVEPVRQPAHSTFLPGSGSGMRGCSGGG